MNTKALYAAIAVIALLIVGLFIYNRSQDNNSNNTSSSNDVVNNANLDTSNANNVANSNEVMTNENTNTSANANSNTTSNADTSANANVNGQFSDEGDIAGKTVQITFDGSKFNPPTVTVNRGDTVVFKNSSTKDFWPASNPHPQHIDYPGFDAKKAIAAGGNYSFVFIKVGTWGFHDHLSPSAAGKIIVQ